MGQFRILRRNPRITITTILLIAFLGIDVSSARLFYLYHGYGFFMKSAYTEKTYRIQSVKFHHGLKPSIYIRDVRWENRSYTVATDSLGFKAGTKKETSLVNERYRIVFIGDSFTEGVGVNYENTFVGRIDSELSKSDIEVINAGVISYSPIIYYTKIKHLVDQGFRFNELIVFIDISDIHDEAYSYEMSDGGNVVTRKALQFNAKTLIRDNTILCYYILNKVYDFLVEIRNGSEFPINIQHSNWTTHEEAYNAFGKKGLQKSRLYMDKLINLLNLNDIELTVAVYPWPAQIMRNDLNSRQVVFWKEWAKKNDVDFINLFPVFINEDCNTSCRTQALDRYFIAKNVHWNEDGHKLVADSFLSNYPHR